MMKIKFEKLANTPQVKLDCNDEYIPFSCTFGDITTLPETIYARNFSNENFIEFRFNYLTNRLYEITLVSIQPNVVRDVDKILIGSYKDSYYACLIESNSELQISEPIEIFKSNEALSLSWNKVIDHFPVGGDFYIGVDINGFLCGIAITSLSEIILAKRLE